MEQVKRAYKRTEEWRRRHNDWARDYYRRNRDSVLAYKQKWNREHKQHNRVVRIKYIARLKNGVLTHYGGGELRCVQCGFGDVRALTIDHINNNGNEYRRKLGMEGNSQNFYYWLRRNDYPDGLQTLCYNCQMIKEIERRRLKADKKAGESKTSI